MHAQSQSKTSQALRYLHRAVAVQAGSLTLTRTRTRTLTRTRTRTRTLTLTPTLTRYNVVALEPDEAMADEKDMDGVDIVELTPSTAWRT